MKIEGIIYFLPFIVILFVVFWFGYYTGICDIRELEDAGYEIVKHEVRHGEFKTNWVEVVKKGAKKQ